MQMKKRMEVIMTMTMMMMTKEQYSARTRRNKGGSQSTAPTSRSLSVTIVSSTSVLLGGFFPLTSPKSVIPAFECQYGDRRTTNDIRRTTGLSPPPTENKKQFPQTVPSLASKSMSLSVATSAILEGATLGTGCCRRWCWSWSC
mgnify:CR=1 FL=1